MAVTTVESAFVLIDRASGPVKRIRRELRGLEKDAVAAGAAMDELSGPRQARELEVQARSTRGLGQEVDTLASRARRADPAMAQYERRTRSNTRESKRFAQSLRDIHTVMGLLKWPVLIAGAGGATQALGGLAGGAVALVPKLLDAGGAAAAAGNLFIGAGAAMGVAKLATKDLSEALGGNEKALKSLTPEGRAFVQMLKEMNPEVERARRVAQRGLFPGLGDLLGEMRSQAPELRRIIKQTSGDLGGLASFGAQQMRGPTFMRDLVQLSDQGGRAFGAAARSGYYLSHALEQMLIAAGPLTDWLGNSIEKWAKTRDEQMEVARATGELDRKFDQTRETLEQLGDIFEHTWHGIGGVLDAARGQSDDLYDSIDKGAERFDDWANSFTGQNKMRRWFDDVRPALDATADLIGALAKGVGGLASGPQGAVMLDKLATAVPDLAEGVGDLTANLGPAAIDALVSGVGLLGDLGAASGPLTIVARAIGTTAEVIDHLVTALGPLGPQVAALATTALLLKKMGLLGAVTGMGGGAVAGGGGGGLLAGLGLGAAARGGRGAASGVSAAEMAVVGGGGAVAGGRLARMRGGAAMFGGTTRDLFAVERALGAGRVGAGVSAMRGASTLTGLAGATGAAGKAFWPLLAVSGGLGALGTQGGIGAKAQGGLSAASMGLVPRPISAEERDTAGGAFAGKLIDSMSDEDALNPKARGSIKGQRQSVRGLRQQIQLLPGNDALDQNKADLEQATKLLQVELKRREQMLKESEQSARDTARAQSVEHAQAMAVDFAKAFDIRAKGPDGPEGAMDRLTDGITKKLKKLNPAGRKVLGENTLAWAAEQARLNPKLKDEYDALERGIKRSFSRTGRHVEIVNGQILAGSASEWGDIRLAITSQTEQARQEASKDFTAIQLQAVGSLTAMGYTPGEARALIRGLEKGTYTAKQIGEKSGSGQPLLQSESNKAKAHGFNGIGDGIGDGPGTTSRGPQGLPTASRASAPNLMGASADLGGYASIGSQFGLSVTSGARPGAITSSGNTSFHASGHAIDMSGPPDSMMQFAKYMASHYGSGLEELIYTPFGGGQIKNGQHYVYTGAVAADHYDHVHVADTAPGGKGGLSASLSMDTAGPGMMQSVSLKAPGTKLKGAPGAMVARAGSLYAAGLEAKLNEALGAGGGGLPGGAGDLGVGAKGSLSFDQVARLAESVGLPGITFAQIAKGESGFIPTAVGHDPGGTQGLGLWQITTGYNDDIIKRFGGREAMFDPRTNAAAAKAIYDRAGIGAWYGTRYMTDPNAHYQGDGIGWQRPQVSAGAPVRLAASAAGPGRGSGGGHVFHFSPRVSVQGTSKAELRREVEKHLDRFVDMVHEEINSGAEEDSMAAMS